jgi:FlaA1/EpsC-like NDP-sugar epimerase
MLKRAKEVLRQHHMVASLVITALCCGLAFGGAFFLRFDFGKVPEAHVMALLFGLPIMVVIRMAALLAFRVHRGLYRYSSLHDFVQLFKAISVGSVVFAALWMPTIGHHYFMPRSIFLLDWMLCMGLLMGLRIGVRLWRNQYRIKPKLQDGSTVSRALIVGAGSLGESILRIVDRRFLGQEVHVVGFVDHSPLKQGSAIHGIPILGPIESVPTLVGTQEVDLILFAIADPILPATWMWKRLLIMPKRFPR